jgi:acetyltransferase-like isoleucine patch superfamily enzyme
MINIIFKIYNRLVEISKPFVFTNKIYKLNKNGVINISKNYSIGEYFNINTDGAGYRLNIGSKFICRKFCSILLMEKCELNIGSNVFLNNYCSINCINKIEIGDGTILGESVKIYDHNHLIRNNSNLKIERNYFKSKPISIGKNCWLGSNVTILKGVTIGDNVVIGANCLIHKSIPSNTIVKLNQDLIISNI